jgi:hypothetical protein
VLVDKVMRGSLRPEYTAGSRPSGWRLQGPGLVSVFPAERSDRTSDQVVTHLLADPRHRAEQQGRDRKRRRT